jgi:hypothetical protein
MLENLAVVEAQVGASERDGGTWIRFTTTENVTLSDYVTLDIGLPWTLKFKIGTISAQDFPQVYVVTAHFKGSNGDKTNIDVRKVLGKKVALVNEEQNKQFKKSEGLI